MRPSLPVLLASLFAAACTTSTALERAEHDVQAHLAKVRAARRQEPRAQEPDRTAKIDRVQPLVGGRRRYRGAPIPLRLSLEAGVGTVAVDVPGTPVDDRTAATQLRLGVEGSPNEPSGPALHLRALSSEGDLFAGTLINDGVAPARADARVRGLSAFPHVRLDGEAADLDFVTRLGLVVDQFAIDHRRAGVERSWLGMAARAQTEARYALTAPRDGRLELFGRLGGQLGHGRFVEDYGVGRGHDWTPQLGLDGALGLRWQGGRWSAALGYEYGRSWFGRTDTSLFGDRSSVGTETQMLFVGGDVQF